MSIHCPERPFASQLGLSFVLVIAISLNLLGCQSKTSAPEPTKPVETPSQPLRLAVVDEPQLSQSLSRLWNAISESGVNATELSVDEFRADDFACLAEYDLVIYPSEFFGDLIRYERLMALRPHLLEDEDFNLDDVLPHEWQLRPRWGDTSYAVSLGHRPWLLAYREDVLASVGAEPPQTWAEYRALCDRLADPPEGFATQPAEAWSPTSEPNAIESRGRLWLARSAAYVRHRGAYSGLFDLRTGAPTLTTPGFERGLQELNEILTKVDPEGPRSEKECWERLVQGHCAMAVCGPQAWSVPTDSEDIDSARDQPALGQIRFAPLPGSSEVWIATADEWRARESDEAKSVPFLDRPGLMISLTSHTARIGTGWSLMTWLSEAAQQTQLLPASSRSFPTRYRVLPEVDRWCPELISPAARNDLVAILREQQLQLTVLMAPRTPGSEQLMEALQVAWPTAAPPDSAETALSDVQTRWQEIQQELGDPEDWADWAEASLAL